MYLRFLKKSVLKLLDHIVYVPGYDCHYSFFPLLVHLAHNRHMLILATWWEQWTCTNIGHLSFSHRSSVTVTHVNTSTIFVYVSNWNFFLSHGLFIIDRQTSMVCVCVCVCLCVDNQYHSHTLATHTGCENSITMDRRTFGKRTALRIFAPETSRANSLIFIHSGSCMAGVIPKSLHFQAQVMLASLAWRHTSTECAKSCA